MKIRDVYTCPLEFVHDIIKGKWKPIIIFTLRKGGMSLSELERSIQGISQKMLLQHLKELQEFDIVNKESYEGYPLKVEYSLTQVKGSRILSAIEIMQDIGIQIMLENDMTNVLVQKGIDVSKYDSSTHKKVGNLHNNP